MSSFLTCPGCGTPLDAETLHCARCPRTYTRDDARIDLRLELAGELAGAIDPWPLEAGGFAAALAGLERGKTFKEALEELLLELDEEHSGRLIQVLREGRGAWLSVLRTSSGRALFCGNALSGAVSPLARFGFEVWVCDPCDERVRFARFRDLAHAPGRTTSVLAGDAPRLPFADDAFDLVVREEGGVPDRLVPDLDELRRVCAGELVWTVDNRLAYKRAHGPHDEYKIPHPARWAREVLAPPLGESTLMGYRRRLAASGFESPRAFALYPHAKQFTNVVALDETTPRLVVGPKERQNRIKVVAKSVGLFPVFTPSFALVGARSGLTGARRVDRMLDALAERTGEPRGTVEHVLGTRGNSSVIHTRGASGELGGPGSWTLHIPLCPKNRRQLGVHYRSLVELHDGFPGVPVPEPLAECDADGIWLTCERRIAGQPGHQICGDQVRFARLLSDAAEQLARLVERPAEPLDEEAFETLVGARFDVTGRFCGVDATRERLARLRDELRERLVGHPLPLAVQHGDLRPKHVMVDDDGRVLGYLDWGTTTHADLPYYDLLHIALQERKQEADLTGEAAWALTRDGGLRPYEREALARYAEIVGMDDEACRAIEAMYPICVGATAEWGWDFSRPRWLHDQYGL